MKKRPANLGTTKFLFIALALTLVVRFSGLGNMISGYTTAPRSGGPVAVIAENLPYTYSQNTQEALIEEEGIAFAIIQPQSGSPGDACETKGVCANYSSQKQPREQRRSSIIIESPDFSGFEDIPFPKTQKNHEKSAHDTIKDKQQKTQKQSLFQPRFHDKTAKIAIIIDDMGVNRKWSEAAIKLPAPITLSFLPYVNDVRLLTSTSKTRGHELMIHVPMEPINPDINLGPMGLRTSMSNQNILNRLEQEIYPSFEGYVGINNHMGSKLTQDREKMDVIMQSLKKRDLYFVDSRTIASSIAAQSAKELGVKYAVRDVFLDHVDSPEFLKESLEKLEKSAHRNGYAIAIGHPRENTIVALQKWLSSLPEKNIELVPASALLTKPTKPASVQIEHISSNNENHVHKENIAAAELIKANRGETFEIEIGGAQHKKKDGFIIQAPALMEPQTAPIQVYSVQ